MKAYLPARESSLLKLVELKERIGYEGLTLLWELLNLNPNDRITAEKALEHSFFDSVRATKNIGVFDFNISSCVDTYQGDIHENHLQFYA